MLSKIERIQKDIESLAKFSCVEGMGCTRFSFTKEFALARDYIMEEMRKAGLTIRQDPVGIVIGRLEGRNPDAPVIMTGSHFDTVKTGGRFDGTAGVVAALETARIFHDNGIIPECPIEFVALPEEEGSRFGGGLTSSRAMCGTLYPNELADYKDWDGISLGEAMESYGLDTSKIAESKRGPDEIKAFLELHIEQGPILENEGKDIGIVEAIVGLRCLTVYVHGKSSHAGTTPINMRADAVLAAAKAIVAGTDRALALNDGTVITFGSIECKPGAFNIVPNEAVFSIDCRSKTLESVDDVLASVRADLEQSVAANPGLSFEIIEKLHAYPVAMKQEIQDLFCRKADEAGISYRKILSGAGHDAMIMGSVYDVAMIFVPSHDGLSHVPEEWTEYSDLQKGIEVLAQSIIEMTNAN